MKPHHNRWQVPEGLDDEKGVAMNKGNVCMAKSSPPCVFKAYLEQFQRDLSLFLKLRSEEVISGGRMVLMLFGRTTEDPSSGECCHIWELLAQAVMEMVSQMIIILTSTKPSFFKVAFNRITLISVH